MEQGNPGLQLLCDFVNTYDVEGRVDALAEPRALDRWLRARGLWGGRATSEELERARSVREALRELMRANNGCAAAPDAAAATLDEAAAQLGVHVRFGPGAVTLASAAGGVGPVLAAAGQAMADGSWQRLKACRSDTCRWAFVDLARNRSRQWCSMNVCGNREKARAYRRRHAGE